MAELHAVLTYCSNTPAFGDGTYVLVALECEIDVNWRIPNGRTNRDQLAQRDNLYADGESIFYKALRVKILPYDRTPAGEPFEMIWSPSCEARPAFKEKSSKMPACPVYDPIRQVHVLTPEGKFDREHPDKLVYDPSVRQAVPVVNEVTGEDDYAEEIRPSTQGLPVGTKLGEWQSKIHTQCLAEIVECECGLNEGFEDELFENYKDKVMTKVPLPQKERKELIVKSHWGEIFQQHFHRFAPGITDDASLQVLGCPPFQILKECREQKEECCRLKASVDNLNEKVAKMPSDRAAGLANSEIAVMKRWTSIELPRKRSSARNVRWRATSGDSEITGGQGFQQMIRST